MGGVIIRFLFINVCSSCSSHILCFYLTFQSRMSYFMFSVCGTQAVVATKQFIKLTKPHITPVRDSLSFIVDIK